jgi:hypothetical protein
MQAKKVFEVQNFERGKTPKASMALGGIVLEKECRNRIEEIRQARKQVETIANQKWEKYLRKTFIGKRITAKMTSLPSVDIKTHLWSGKRETKDFTITVEDVNTQQLTDLLISIGVADTDNNMYVLPLDEKIYFE